MYGAHQADTAAASPVRYLGSPKTDAEAVRIVRTANDNGVNFMDNSWDYNGGTSELRIGTALRDGYRGKVFLMTKIDGQDGKTAQQQLNESLQSVDRSSRPAAVSRDHQDERP